jgi:hypothetical protein
MGGSSTSPTHSTQILLNTALGVFRIGARKCCFQALITPIHAPTAEAINLSWQNEGEKAASEWISCQIRSLMGY